MGPLLGETELSKALIETGNNLLKPHSSTDAFLNLLDETGSLLSTVPQDPIASVQSALLPSMKALVSADLLRNPDSDVRVFVVSCLTEIMRITAPDAPYNDVQMKEIFQATVEAFGKLADASCRSYRKAEAVLETVAKVRSSLVMLDLECDDLVLEMFRQFLKTISPDHPQPVLLSMETVMLTVIEESEEVSMDLLEILLTAVKKESQDVSPAASRLVEKVLSICVRKLQPCIMESLKSKGTSLDNYSPVVFSLFQSESATTQAHNVVNAKENEADEKISEKQLIPSDSLVNKLDVGLSRKGNRSKRTARGGTGNDLNQLMKIGQSESTDAETESGSTGKRRRKPNSLKNPEEGYSFKTSLSNKMQDKGIGDSSLGKLAAKKVSLPTKVGQTNQSVVISLSPSSKARTGSRKRSRTKMEEMSNDVGSIATPLSKKKIVKKDNPKGLMEPNSEKPEDGIKTTKSSEKKRARNGLVKTSAKKPLAEIKMAKTGAEKSVHSDAKKDLMEPNSEKPEDGIKTTKSSEKKRARNGLVKTSAKKPLAEIKMAKTGAEKSVHSDAKKKNSEGASTDTPIPQSSKRKKKISHEPTPLTKKTQQTPKSHHNRKRTTGEKVESNTNELGKDLVGKKVNVWWPLDKKFYKGVIKSYNSHKKRHLVFYADGDAEELNLKKERFEIIPDDSSTNEDKESDLPDSILLSDLIKRLKVKKLKTASMKVEPSSSPEVKSSVRTAKKKEPVTDITEERKRTKGAITTIGNEPESSEGKKLKSLTGRTEGRTGKKQKVARAVNRKSDKDCDEKEDPETKGGKLRKSKAELNCNGEPQELPENQNAETRSGGQEQNSANEPNAEPETDGEEHSSLKESNTEPKTDGEEHSSLKESNAERKTDGKEQGAGKEPTGEPKTDDEEQKSVKESNEERDTKVEERKSEKEPDAEPETKVEEKEQTEDTKLIEEEDMSDRCKGARD